MRTLIAVLLLLAAGPAGAQSVAVYESETNAAEYHGIYQEPLRHWLKERGQAFTVIGDAVAADAGKLAAYPVVLASSTYLVAAGACKGLEEYVAQGGQVLWIDSPARCQDPAFRRLLGLGPESTYAPLTGCTLTRKEPAHPASLSVSQVKAASLVGNPATAAGDGATLLYELAGTDKQGKAARFPAVVLSRQGKGQCLCCNWIVWATADAELRAVVSDGLDYLLASVLLRRQESVALPGPVAGAARQPAPLGVSGRLYRRGRPAGAPGRCEVRLLGKGDRTAAGPVSAGLTWTAAGEEMSVAVAAAELPTRGLPDGDYRVRFRFPDATVSDRRVTLEGQAWQAVVAAEGRRWKLLAPRLAGTLGDYDAEPRTPAGRVDIPRLLEEIAAAHMDTYDWLIWHAPTDWEDLHLFLPAARKAGVKVWVTLCPPSEQGELHSEPYRLDFIRWAQEIGKLSKQYDNLAAFVIDDFWSGGNHALFTPGYVARMAQALREQNPRVAFLPTIYWGTIGDRQWMDDYGPAIDGIVFPYAELKNGDRLAEQLKACREWIGTRKLLMVNVYASGSSGDKEPGPRTAEYMRTMLTVSREKADGIRIYCLPKEKLLDDYRFAVVAELYGKWRAEKPKR